MDRKTGIILLLCWLLGLSLYDIRYKRVPVWMILLGAAAAAVSGINSDLMNFFMGMIPGAILLLLALGTRKAGWADGIVLVLLGSMLGFRQCILTVMFSLVMISVLSAILLVLKKADKGTTIPYVPFLTMGYVLCKMMGG